MEKKFPILKTAAWTVIGLWLVRSLVFSLANIDFASAEITITFRQIWVFLIPLAVGTLIVQAWKGKTSNTRKAVGLTAGVLLSVGLMLLFNFLSNFCVWQFSQPLYKHKSENMEIRQRVLNCGAWDADPTYQLVKTKPIGTYLIKYSPVKEKGIDESEWTKE